MQNPSSFGFGTTGAQPASTGLFGSATATTSGGMFGTQAGTGGGLFGTTTSSSAAPTLFGNTTPNFGASTNASLGGFNVTPSSVPSGISAFVAQQSAVPNFGGTATITPSLGTTTTSAPGFGITSNVTPGFGIASTAPTFGSTATPTFGATPGFGATATPAFGVTTTPAFGSTTTTAFGTTATPAFGATATPSFGATATPTPAFGTTATPTPAFGTTAAAKPAFGTTAAATPAFGTSAAVTPAFGATTTATSAFGAAATPNTASPFGATAVTTSSTAPAFGFSTGAPSTSTPANSTTGLGFSLGATSTSVNAPTTTSAPLGLGSLSTTQTKVVTARKDVTTKDQPLPNEILQSVDSFKEFVKQQKIHSSDIAKCSIRDFRKVEQDINHLTTLLGEVESQLLKNRQSAENLKYETANCLKDVEIAQRTQDTPPGLQYENTAPLKFFLNLVDKFERDMQVIKIQVESADSYVKNYRNPTPLTPHDVTTGIRRLHESFVALAGRIHTIHNQVESQKELYLQTRRQTFNDHSNPFDCLNKPQEENIKTLNRRAPPKVATGPTPFSSLALGNTQLMALQQNQTTMPYSTPPTTTPGFGNVSFGTSFGHQTPTHAAQLFGTTSALAQNSNSFQLQKPPTGNKRGKQ